MDFEIKRIVGRLSISLGRRGLDLRMMARYLRDGWGLDLLRSRAPGLHTPPSPTTVGVELTNVCQLRCPHCDAQNPAIRGKAGYMAEDTFTRLVAQLRALRVRNLRLIGGGEPLLHPKFASWVAQLRGLASLVSITTNGQRLTPENSAAALAALDVIEVSVASDNAAGFAQSRTGGDFEELLQNLARLRRLRDRTRSRTAIHIRVMLRPSEQPTVDRLLAFWQRYGDVVSTQRLQDYFDQQGDVFVRGKTEEHPPCVLPFRSLGVSWDGSVPLCRVSAFQAGSPDGLVLGNIRQTTLADIWQGVVIRQYRDGHRRGDPALMPVCRNCPDPQRPAWRKTYDTNAHIERASSNAAGFVPLRAVARRAPVPELLGSVVLQSPPREAKIAPPVAAAAAPGALVAPGEVLPPEASAAAPAATS
jgi:MoaA/NifB/PqqE/SkfB family radical SAM enzyme